MFIYVPNKKQMYYPIYDRNVNNHYDPIGYIPQKQIVNLVVSTVASSIT